MRIITWMLGFPSWKQKPCKLKFFKAEAVSRDGLIFLKLSTSILINHSLSILSSRFELIFIMISFHFILFHAMRHIFMVEWNVTMIMIHTHSQTHSAHTHRDTNDKKISDLCRSFRFVCEQSFPVNRRTCLLNCVHSLHGGSGPTGRRSVWSAYVNV